MNSIALHLPVKAATIGNFGVTNSIKNTSVRAADSLSRASDVVTLSFIDSKGAVGKAARARTAFGGNRAIALALLSGNYAPVIERLAIMGDFNGLSCKSRTEWADLRKNLQFMLDATPVTTSKKGLPTGKYGKMVALLEYYDSINELAIHIVAERQAAKDAATEVIAA